MYEAGVEQNTNKNEFTNAKIAYVGLMCHLFVKVRLANFSKQTKPNIKLQMQKSQTLGLAFYLKFTNNE